MPFITQTRVWAFHIFSKYETLSSLTGKAGTVTPILNLLRETCGQGRTWPVSLLRYSSLVSGGFWGFKISAWLPAVHTVVWDSTCSVLGSLGY